MTNGGTDDGRAKMTLTVAGSKVFVAFGFSGTLKFDGQGDAGALTTTAASQDVFVAALDAQTGATQWHETFGSPNDDTVEQIVASPQGGAVLVGTMQGTMTGLTGPGFPLQAGGDAGNVGPQAYVVKVDSTGKPVYAFTYASDPAVGGSTGLGVATSTGLVAVGGYFTGTVDLGAGPVVSQGGNDGFVALVDETSMKTKFVVPLAGAGNDAFRAVALDAWGELFAAGTYGVDSPASASLGSVVLPQTQLGVTAMVLAKIDPTGKLLWSHPFAPTASDGGVPDTSYEPQGVVATRIRATASGQVAVTGEMSGGTDFGAGYAGLLSTLHVATTCVFIANGQNSHCQCSTHVPDGFVGVWQP